MNKKVLVVITSIFVVSLIFVNYWVFQNPYNGTYEKKAYILVNQVGYFKNSPKVAIIRTNYDFSGQQIKLINLDTNESTYLPIGNDLGEGYNFKHHFVVNFTNISSNGTFYFELENNKSPAFKISNELYQNVFDDAFNFFQLNHCGESKYHNVCHTDDGIIANGHHKGYHINVTGGWHDAGDYIKFTSTSAETLILLMETALFNPNVAKINGLISEISWGLKWMEKIWIRDWKELIFMVGNMTDHNQGFRLPENDTLHNRPVYVCEDGKGANVAGLVSAVFSLASLLSSENIINSTYAVNYESLAVDTYEFGERNKNLQETGLGDWIAYPDWGWQDDMALAAILLYKLTENESYYHRAISYFNEFSNVSNVPYTISNLLAAYYLFTSGYDNAFDSLYYTMLWNLNLAHHDPLFWPWPEYYWGSLYTSLVLSFAEILYRNATGNSNFREFSINALDYVFGRNQWSICFVTGYGTRYPHSLHHQILYLKSLDVSGILVEGGVSKKLIQEMNIDLLPESEDPYAVFQSDKAFYQDVYWNYVTNEPTIRSQALFAFVVITYLG